MIKNFLFKCLSYKELGSMTVMLLTLILLLTGIQSLFFGLGQVSPYFGLALDLIGFICVVGFIGFFAVAGDRVFPCEETAKKRRIYILLSLLAIFAVYVNVAIVYLWLVLALCMAVLLFCGIMFNKLGADIERITFAISIFFIYCICTYWAMLVNGIEPPIDKIGISLIFLAAIYCWFKLILE